MQEWKHWQHMYNSLVTDHTDAREKHAFRISGDKVSAALQYCLSRSPEGVYPGKSRIVAIIYATLLEKVYGEDFYEVLDDPNLLYGQDEFFATYSDDKETYDEILLGLEEIPNWIDGGWAPKTVEYFYLECTQKGVDSINGIL